MPVNFEREVKEKVQILSDQIKNIQKKSNNKFVIYSALTNGYDDIVNQRIQLDNVDFIFICDSSIKSDFWNIIKTDLNYRDPRRTAKIFKILPHLLLGSYEASLWIDANLLLKSDVTTLIDSFIKGDSIITMVDHDKRRCIYKEAKECNFWNRDKTYLINNQIENYRNDGYPTDNGLINGRFILRKHNITEVKSLMEFWWSEIDSNSVRDQISFNYASWRSGIKYDSISSDKRDDYIQIIEHKLDINYGVSSSLLLKLKHLVFNLGLTVKEYLR